MDFIQWLFILNSLIAQYGFFVKNIFVAFANPSIPKLL